MIPSTSTSPTLPWPLRLVRRALPFLLLLTLLGGLLGVYRWGVSLGEPFPGFVLLWRKEYKLFTVSWVTPPHWSGPAAGMKVNDRILCINDYVPSPTSVVYGLEPRYAEYACSYDDDAMNYTAIFRQAYQSADPTVDILIDRDGEIQLVSDVPLLRFNLWHLLEIFAPSFLLGLALLGLGWVVFRANPGIESNLIFSLIMLAASNYMFHNNLAGHITDREFDSGRMVLVQVIPWSTFLGPLVFHLVSLICNQGIIRGATRHILRVFYLLAGVFAVVGWINFLFNDAVFARSLTWVYILWIAISWIVTGLWALISIFQAYRHATHRQVRMQTGLVLIALALSMLIGIPYAGLFFANHLTFAYMQGLPYLALVVVGLIAYAILRYQLFAARTRTLTFLLVLVVSVIAALTIYLPAGNTVGFMPLLGTSLLASSVFAGRLKAFNFLDRLLHRQEADYQVAERFGHRIRQPQSMEHLAEAATRALKEELEAEQVDLWLCHLDQPVLEHYLAGRPAGFLPLEPALSLQLVNARGPAYVDSEPAQAFAGFLADGAQLHPHGLWVPLADRDHPLGLLYIGPRWTGEIYTEDDIRLVRLLTVQLGLAIANTRQVERLQNLQRMIFQAEENERYKIARELHDTVLQFLLVLTFGLDSLKEKPAQLSEQVDDWQGRISAEASRLRDLLSYLRTPEALEQRGLLPALEALLQTMRHQTTTRVDWEFDPRVEQALDADAKAALYRVLREAAYNTLKHARAQQITVRLERVDDQVTFSAQDDGLGFNLLAAMQSSGKGYSSLQDMRIYVESTGGQLEITTAPGQGTKVQGWMPVLDRVNSR
jgi:signal transduction histidine kinase